MLQKRSPFSRNVWLTVSMLVAMAALFATYTMLEQRIDRANTVRYESMRLADELRLSSEELTRMVRTYIATGNPVY